VADLRFEWHPTKAEANVRKHGVSFLEARSVFYDDDALLLDDPAHSSDEPRFLILGLSVRLRVVVVVHCYRAGDAVIRLISARRATAAERAQYEQRRRT
jgi:uncharacterized protein